jgi:hypothetical protein
VSALRAVALALVAGACKHGSTKATPAQCEAIVDRFAELVVQEAMPDASAAAVAAERAREKSEARGADVFKNCASQVDRSAYDCAMRAESTDALEKCLE